MRNFSPSGQQGCFAFIQNPILRPKPKFDRPNRLFFALKPQPLDAARIALVAAGLVGAKGCRRMIDAARLHVSMVSLGEYGDFPETLVDEATDLASSIVAQHVNLAFDRLGRFGGGAIVLYNSKVDDGLQLLRTTILDRMSGLPAARNSNRNNFKPHMTISYDGLLFPQQVIDPIRWSATELILVHSLVGKSRHIHLGSWTLRANWAET